MKLIFSSWRYVVTLTFTMLMLSCSQQRPVDDLYHYAQKHKHDLQLSCYITVGAVETCLNNTDGRREAVSVLRSLGITKAYIETYRGGRIADEELLKTVRDYFNANGLATVGGIATVPGKDFGVHQEGQLGWFNFQHPKTQQDLERVVRLTARVFDEMIVDDFLCTADTSEMSVRARGDRTWSQYRMDLLTQLSANLFVRAAREENSRITIIMKYPQWYDRFHMFGYDVVREPKIYDKIWVGTETRGPLTRRMGFVQQYGGFVNFRWISTLAPNKMGGAWFDHIDCNKNDFIDQAYQSVLAGAREIILFNYFNLMNGHPGHHLLRKQFSELVRLASMVRDQPATGVYGYKPPHSDPQSDYYIFDYMGMIGVPLLPMSKFPADAKVIFLPTQASKDDKLVEQMESSISQGKTLVLTTGLVKKLAANPRLLALTGVRVDASDFPVKVSKLFVGDEVVDFKMGLDLAGILTSTSAKVILAARHGQKQLPVLTMKAHSDGGKVYVLNFNTYSEKDFKAINEVLLAPKPVSWLSLPTEWLNTIRDVFIQPLGVKFNGQGRIALYLFGDTNVVLYNFNDEPVQVQLELKEYGKGGREHFVDKLTGEKISSTDERLRLSIDKRRIRWIGKPE